MFVLNCRLLDLYIYQHGVSKAEGAIDVHNEIKMGAYHLIALRTGVESKFDMGRYVKAMTIGPMTVFTLDE